MKLGGTTNLADLPSIGRIRYLELWMIRGFVDLDPVAQMPDLEFLFLQALRRVEHLPDLSNSTNLRWLWLETMKGLTDFSAVTTAPHLEHVALVNMGHLSPDDLAPLMQAPSLKSIIAGLGSDRKNRAVEEMLGSLTNTDRRVWNSDRYRSR